MKVRPEVRLSLAPDELLVAKSKEGDRQAYRFLVDRHKDAIAATVVGMLGPGVDVDDVTQETFIRFFQTIDRFRGEAALPTYLKRIAINRSLDILRRRKRVLSRFFSRDDDNLKLPELGKNDVDPVEQNDLRDAVTRALQKLPATQRTVVILRMVEGYSTEETAEMLNIAFGTVLSRLNRARKTLKELLSPIKNDADHPRTSNEGVL